MSETRILESATLDQLRAIHALKSAALSMFDPMLERVAVERDAADTPEEVAELLGRMHGVFSGHREETSEHRRDLAIRIRDVGGNPARALSTGLSAGAKAWVAVGGLGGQNHGANARNAFVFEHLEIASWRLLEQLAERSGDDATLAIATRCVAQDQEMAATIDRNWTNVLTLKLAAA